MQRRTFLKTSLAALGIAVIESSVSASIASSILKSTAPVKLKSLTIKERSGRVTMGIVRADQEIDASNIYEMIAPRKKSRLDMSGVAPRAPWVQGPFFGQSAPERHRLVRINCSHELPKYPTGVEFVDCSPPGSYHPLWRNEPA
jgi:hypothetical protein